MNPEEIESIESIDELSPMQQAMLFHSLMAPGSGVYVLQMSLRMTGRLDVPAFERAWRYLVARHSILRTAFFWEELETPRQVAFREVELTVERESWRGLGAGEQQERLARFLEADRARGFVLTAAPLLRLTLLELAADVHQLVWTQHHLVADGWSQGAVLCELVGAYADFSAGREPDLPPAPDFHDYLAWLRRQDLGAAEAFWRRSLAGLTAPTFLAGREERAGEPGGQDARRRDLALPAAVGAALREVARRRRLTPNTLVQGAWALLLAQESGREDVVFGATVAGRPADLPGVEEIAGPFLNTLPLRVAVAPESRLHAWLAALQEQQVEARRYEHAPLVDVQRWSGLPAGVALFDHILVFENLVLPAEPVPLAGLEIVEEAASSLTNYPLAVVVIPSGERLLLSLRWDAARCGTPEVVRLLERLAQVLTAFAEDGDPRLGELALLLPGERQQLLCEWNDTAAQEPPGLLHELFAAQAAARPEALAVVWEGQAWTYRELAERAHRLAALLRGRGAGRGTPVGVWMERSPGMLAGVLGILEAGGFYVPLDPSWPADRVETILAATGAPVILTSQATLPAVERLRWRLPRLGDAVCLDLATPEPPCESLDAAGIRALFDFVAERAADGKDRVLAGGFVSRRTGLPFSEAEVDEYRDRVLALAAPWLRPDARVLEVGCGAGLILWEMARRVERCTGLDPSERTQERNREHARAEGIANVELPSGFAHEIGARFAPGSFDLVLCASTVQFFPGPRYLGKVIADALTLLAPGGALLVADVIDARREPAADTLALDEELFHDLGRAEIHHRTEGFANELGERYDVILQPRERERRKRTWTGWHVDRSPALPLPAVGSPEDVAYVIHTSGSTGLPKGIAVQHAPAVRLVRWVNRTFGVGPADRLLFVTSLGFDLSVWDVFGMLAAGGTVHVAGEAALREPAELVRLLRTEPVTIWDSAPAALQQLAPLFPDGAPRPLRLVMLSGDWIPVPLPDQVRAAFPGARVISLGGATEATVWSNWYPIEAVDPRRPSIPYGRPIANARYHALDGWLRPCPIGVPGDLYIGGACLCVGYTGQPALTAAAFLPDPFAGEPGARLYRTGDRVRFFADGNLEFLGRVDQQVKIHGYRIELGEIEVALLRHRRVREAVVQVRDGRLAAWVVPGDGGVPEAHELRAWLAESLPAYMLPAAFVVLPALPVTANGKLDRKALPAPDLARTAEYEAPSGPEEEMLAALWSELLGAGRVGARDNFFALGGHSLLATRVVSRLRATFGVEVPLRSLFEAPTVAELARVVRATRAGVETPVIPVPRQGALPLSFAQQRLWLLDQLEPGSAAYNVPLAVRLRGALAPALLRQIFAELVRRHEILRTTFDVRSGEPVQRIAAPFTPELPVIDLAGLPGLSDRTDPSDRSDPSDLLARQARALARDEARRPFDLRRGPLLRLTLLRLAAEEHVLLITLHHVIADGWSTGVLLREIGALGAAFVRGGASPLPELPVQYADFAVWQRGRLQGAVLEEQLGAWTRRLAGAPRLLELPTDRPRPAVQTFRGATRPVVLGAVAELPALCRQAGATPFMALLAAWALLLGRHAGQDDVVVGSPVAGRNRREIEELIGLFVNTLVFRIDLGGAGTSFAELLRRTREVALDAFAHQDLPFERLVEEVATARDLSVSPLFQAFFSLQNLPIEAIRLPGLELEPVAAESTVAKFDLSLYLAEGAGGIGGALEFNTDLFDGTTAEHLAARYARLVAGAVADPECPLGALPLLLPAEREELLTGWNGTAERFPEDLTVHELIAAQVARTPDAVALSFAGERWSYRALWEEAGRQAARLAALGVGPEVLVAVRMERSPRMLEAVLGVLRAGGAYVPLDPAHPRERLAFILEDARVRVVVRDGAVEALTPGGGGATALPENLAYVIYTSGSTGRPKGVAVRHRGAVNYLATMARRPGISARDVVVALTTLAFDISVTELLLPLTAGARIELVGRETAGDAALLAAALESSGATMLQATPATWTMLLEGGWAGRPGLRALCGGEALPRALAEKLLPRAGELWNVYGPTETTVWASAHRVEPGTRPIPLGRPLGNTIFHLLGLWGELVPPGAAGELCIGGAGLARGYHGRPELTAERFVPDPFGGAGGRLYRTGDLARRLPDGLVEYLGRIDFQVKVRGFRIELGEIEAALRGHPAVRDAVAGVLAGPAGDPGLVAWVVLAPEAGIDNAQAVLAGSLRERLPDYMIPADFVVLPAFPLTPTGKVDRRALPAPDRSRRDGGEGLVAPRTPVERALAAMWQELLGAGRVGVEDGFFELGGHSLLATRLRARVEQAFGVDLPLAEIFRHPVLAGLAARIEARVRPEDEGSPVPVPLPRTDGGGAFPLAFAQEHLCLDPLVPGNPAWNIPFPVRLHGELSIPLLQRAFAEVVRRHEALRTTFATRNGEGVQVIHPAERPALPVIDLAGLPGLPDRTDPSDRSDPSDPSARQARQARQARDLARQEAWRPFDLGRGPLLRLALVRLAARDHLLLLTVHHIVADGWSMGVLVREVAALLAAFAAGRPSPLPELPYQVADFAVWQRRRLRGAVLEEQLAFWKNALAGAPAELDLRTGRPRPAVRAFRGTVLERPLRPAVVAAVRDLCRRLDATPFMALLAAWGVLVGRLAGQDEVLVGSPVAGRHVPGSEGLIGFFANTVVLRLAVPAEATFATLLARVRATVLAAFVHQDMPFDRLAEELVPERDLSRPPLVQVLFALQNAVQGAAGALPPVPGLTLSAVPVAGETAKLDLSLHLAESPEGLTAFLEIDTGLFGTAMAEEILDRYERLLEEVAGAPDALLARPPARTAAAIRRLPGRAAAPEPLGPREDLEGHPERPAPLSFSQERMGFLHLLDPQSPAYNLALGVRLDGALRPAVLTACFLELRRRHQVLATRYELAGARPVQVADLAAPFALAAVDLTALPEERRRAELPRLQAIEAARPFDLVRGPVLRATLVRLAAAEHALLLTLHHIATDGWSQGILLQELAALYAAFAAGAPSPFPAPRLQYADFAVWQRRRLHGEVLEEQLAWWRRQLPPPLPVLRLPTDRPRAANQPFQAGTVERTLPADLADELRALGRARGASLFMVLLAAFAAVLERTTGDGRILVGTPVAGRNRVEVEGLVGFFLNTLILPVGLEGDPRFDTLLAGTAETALGAFAHQDLPLETLLQELRLERGARGPFQVMLLLQNLRPPAPIRVPGLTLSPLFTEWQMDLGTSIFDLGLTVEEDGPELRAVLTYNARLFEEATAGRLLGRLAALLAGVVADPGTPLSELPLLTAAEERELLAGDATEAVAAGASIPALFAAQAARAPEAEALRHAGRSLTYGALDRWSRTLAARLSAAGVGPEVRVGVFLERSPAIVAAFLAVLRAGGVYAPLDPALPAERLAWILADLAPEVLLTDGALLPRIAWEGKVLFPDAPEGEETVDAPLPPLAPEQGAYVIYTSGSTGRPKGVLVPHGALAAFVAAARSLYGIGPDDRVLQFAALGFDTGVEEIYPCLTAGGTLVLRTDEMAGTVAGFLRGCEAEGITVLDLPTAFWHELVVAPELASPEPASPEPAGRGLPSSVRAVILGGERPLPERVAAWLRPAAAGEPRARLFNTYGPTEATVVATAAELPPALAAEGWREVPMGRPLAGVRAFAVDRALRPVPVDVPGELLLGGAGLARGYLGRPDLTAERFVPDPSGSAAPGGRLYRTGDLVRRRVSGDLEFAGRVDQQVKIRGFRVEPGEIEAVLAGAPGVAECAVACHQPAAREDASRPGDLRLVAYVVAGPGVEISSGALRDFLESRLPAWMVPAAFVPLPALPRTPTGKIDRRALPAPDALLPATGQPRVAPRTEVEEIVAEIWCEALGLPRVSVFDSFFELGGHSLLLLQVLQRLRDAFGVEIPLRSLYEERTVAALAAKVEELAIREILAR